MKRPKYHFIILKRHSTGRSFMALPGQTFGRSPVPEDIYIKDANGSTALTKAKKTASDGQVFFTTTLCLDRHILTVTDLYPLNGCDLVFYSDVEEEYAKYITSASK